LSDTRTDTEHERVTIIVSSFQPVHCLYCCFYYRTFTTVVRNSTGLVV